MRTLLLPLLLLMSLCSARAEGVHVREWRGSEGKPEAGCVSMARTAGGAVWAGTLRGLVRVEPDRLTPVALTGSGFPDDAPVHTLFADSGGRVWVSTAYGITVLKDGRVLPGTWNEGWPGETPAPVHSWAETADGTIYAAAYDTLTMAGIYRYDGQRWQALPQLITENERRLHRVEVVSDAQGRIWGSQSHDVLCRLDDKGQWERILPNIPPEETHILFLVPSPAGGFRVVCERWLLHCGRNGWETPVPLTFPPASSDGQHLTAAEEDGGGRLWLASDTEGMRIFDLRTRAFARVAGLPASVLTVLRGEDGVMWAGGRYRIFEARALAPGEAPQAPGAAAAPASAAPAAEGPAPVIVTRRFSREDGLPHDQCTALARTSDGFLWVGTRYGLVRCDGRELRPVLMGDSLAPPRAAIASLYADRQDRVWVSTSYGIVVVKDGAVLPGPWNEGWPSGAVVKSWAEKADGHLYAAGPPGETAGLYHFDGARWHRLPPLAVEPGHDQRRCGIICDDTGTLWARQSHQTLGRLAADGQWERMVPPIPAADLHILALVPAARGGFWLLSEQHVVHHGRDGWGTPVPVLRESRATRDVAAVCEDDRGRLWTASEAEGVHILDPATGQAWLVGNVPLSAATVAHVGGGAMWIGSREGLAQAWESRFVRMAGAENFAGNPALEMVTAPDGRVFVSTARRTAGVAWTRERPEDFLVFSRAPGAAAFERVPSPVRQCLTLAVDAAGQLWTSGEAGVQRWSARGADTDIVPAQRGWKPAVRDMALLPGGIMCMTGNQGVYEWRDGVLTVLPPAAPDAPAPRRALHTVAVHGEEAWASGPAGLFRRARGAWHGVAVPAGTESIIAMEADGRDDLWLLARGGQVLRLSGGKFSTLPLHSLAAHRIHPERLVIAAGHLWLADVKAVAAIPLEEARRALDGTEEPPFALMDSCGLKEGAALNLDGHRSVGTGADGQPWFVTRRGDILTARPVETAPDPGPLTALVESVSFDGAPAQPAGADITAPAGTSTAVLQVLAPDVRTTLPARFRIRMDEGPWTVHDSGDIILTGLRAGARRIEIQSARTGGLWNPVPAVLRVTVQPAWWQTVWGMAGLSTVSLACLVWAIRFIVLCRLRRQRAVLQKAGQLLALRQDAIDAEECDRTRIARELHDHLGASLTGLRIHAGIIHKALVAQDSPLAQQTAVMTRILDEAVPDVRRLVTELRPSVLDDLSLEEAIRWQASRFTQISGIPTECRVECPAALAPESTRDIALYRILQDLLSGVSSGTERVRIGLVQPDAEHLLLSVQAEGRGLHPDRTEEENRAHSDIRQRVLRIGGGVSSLDAPRGCITTVVTVPVHPFTGS